MSFVLGLVVGAVLVYVFYDDIRSVFIEDDDSYDA